MTQELVTVGEAATILKVQRETIRRYIKSGYLQALILPGGDYRLREKDIQKLLSCPAKRGVDMAMVTEGERLTLSVPEAANVLGISRGLAYNLARRDALPVPVIKLGRRMVLSRKAVEALLSGKGEVSHDNNG